MSAFGDYEAIIRHARYEEAIACARVVNEMQGECDFDASFLFVEKHTDRVLTHAEVYAKALANASHMIYERADAHYGGG